MDVVVEGEIALVALAVKGIEFQLQPLVGILFRLFQRILAAAKLFLRFPEALVRLAQSVFIGRAALFQLGRGRVQFSLAFLQLAQMLRIGGLCRGDLILGLFELRFGLFQGSLAALQLRARRRQLLACLLQLRLLRGRIPGGERSFRLRRGKFVLLVRKAPAQQFRAGSSGQCLGGRERVRQHRDLALQDADPVGPSAQRRGFIGRKSHLGRRE